MTKSGTQNKFIWLNKIWNDNDIFFYVTDNTISKIGLFVCFSFLANRFHIFLNENHVIFKVLNFKKALLKGGSSFALDVTTCIGTSERPACLYKESEMYRCWHVIGISTCFVCSFFYRNFSKCAHSQILLIYHCPLVELYFCNNSFFVTFQRLSAII